MAAGNIGLCGTARLRTLFPEALPGMVFGSRVLKWAVDGTFGGPLRVGKGGRPEFQGLPALGHSST